MSKLSTYLADNGISQRDFAAQVGIDQSVVSRFARGEATPSLSVAFTIERITHGAVPAATWDRQQVRP